jgi:hypothetical protein
MSNAPKQTPSNSSANLNSTRQLLDELDALMKRMLDLPVGEGSQGLLPDKTQTAALLDSPPQESGSESEIPVEEERLPAPVGFPGYQDEPETEPVAAPQPFEPENLARSLMEKGKRSEAESSQESPEETPPVEVATARPILEKSRLTAHLPKPRRKWWFPILTGINWAFDLGTHLLGPAGKWMRQNSGRTILGFIGVGLLLTALTWQILLWTVWK